MFYYSKILLLVLFFVLSNIAYSDSLNSGVVNTNNNARGDFGWGGSGGSNLEMYSKNDATGRQGELRFVYGGSTTKGNVMFTHYNGSGWSAKMILDKDGKLGINTGSSVPCSDCFLAVKGKIQAEEVVVSTTWADHVFQDNYKLMALKDVETYIDNNGHLPGVPSASDVVKGGVNLGDMTKTLLEKVEELTLHMIDLKKENEVLKEKIASVIIQK